MPEKRLAFIIPARNEEALIAETLEAIVKSIAHSLDTRPAEVRLHDTAFELIVADDGSDDSTPQIVQQFAHTHGVQLIRCSGRSCASARNAGARASTSRLLCFVDADTLVPPNAVRRILEHHERHGKCLVLYKLVSREPGVRAWLWWTFWGLARSLPLARAKSLPGFMSCSRDHFEQYGPFNESWLIAEEWSLTGAAYRYHRERFVYDRSVVARTSSRRMELQPFGYVRTFAKWVGVVLFPWARTSLNDRIRHTTSSR